MRLRDGVAVCGRGCGMKRWRGEEESFNRGGETFSRRLRFQTGLRKTRPERISQVKNSVIALQGVHKYYGEIEPRLHVLKGIDLEVGEGEFVSITGTSGSGKSTLLNLLGCLDNSSQGSYLLNGKDVSRFSDDDLSRIRNQDIGFIFQSFNLIQH